MHPLIIDAFPYNGDEIVEYRLQQMDRHVDLFLIVEARETFTGQRKPVLYSEQNAALFEPYRHKIRFVTVDSFPPAPQEWVDAHRNKWGSEATWWREAYQRDICWSAAVEAAAGQPFILLVSDADELPHPRLFADRGMLYEQTREPLALSMDFHYYNFNWLKPGSWRRAFLVNDQKPALPTLDDLRRRGEELRSVVNGGWHLSFFSSLDTIARKLGSFSHTQFNQERYKDLSHIQRCIEAGKDLFERDTEPLEASTDLARRPPGWEALQAQLEQIQQPRTLASDKHFWHRYLPHYLRAFETMAAPQLIVEFGVFHGASIRWLLERFPKAQIIGADILPVQPDWPVDPRVHYVQLDQGNEGSVAGLLQRLSGQIDLLIEDGSHYPWHQMNCLRHGIPAMRPGGVYILEDIHTAHPDHPTFHQAVATDPRRAAALHLLLAAEHGCTLRQPLPAGRRAALAAAIGWTPEDLDSWLTRVQGLDVIRRGNLPLSCFACGGSDFDYVALRCQCGTELYSSTDSMTAIIRAA